MEDLRVSVFICYDLRFADEFWQLAPDTDLYLVVANWPEPRREHWRACCGPERSRTRPTCSACNRVGEGDGIHYTGDSAILDPIGRTLAEASLVETVLIAEVDPGEVKRVRDRFPFLADRRGHRAGRADRPDRPSRCRDRPAAG